MDSETARELLDRAEVIMEALAYQRLASNVRGYAPLDNQLYDWRRDYKKLRQGTKKVAK